MLIRKRFNLGLLNRFLILAWLFLMLANSTAHAGPPPAPNVTWPTAGSIVNSNRPDIAWTGGFHDAYEVHVGLYNVSTSSEGWNSGTVFVGSPMTTVTTAPLGTQQTYYVFVRHHNADGWGPWSQPNVHFYVAGELLNDPYLVAGADGWQRAHGMCYNPTRNEYLACYFDAKTNQRSYISYYRLDGTGAKLGIEMSVFDDLEGVGGPWVCYNSALQEYLITYGGYTSSGGVHSEIRVQRVNAITGGLIGGSVWIDSAPGSMLSKVAYSTVSNSYLLVWENGGGTPVLPVYAQRLSSTADPLGNIFQVSNGPYFYAGNPSICYNSVEDEFFVTFQEYKEIEPQTWWDYHGQRVRASDGALMGGNITIAATPEYDSNGDVAYDGNMNRYLVVYDGGPPSPWGQFVSATGTLIGGPFSIGGADYHGGMVAAAWSPITKEWLVTWASCCSANHYARRLTQGGAYIGEPLRTNGDVMGFGNWDPLPVINTNSGEFLINWFWQYDNVYVRRYKTFPPPAADVTAPVPVTGLTLQRFPSSITLNWTNPATSDFMGTSIRFKTTGFPTGPTDGVQIADLPNAPSTSDTFTHTGLVKGTTYYYAVFAHDEAMNYASAVVGSAKIFPGDFDGDDDVDMQDFAHFQNCLSGDSVPYGLGCTDADLNEDNDVDQGDFAMFLPCLAGANMPPGC